MDVFQISIFFNHGGLSHVGIGKLDLVIICFMLDLETIIILNYFENSIVDKIVE